MDKIAIIGGGLVGLSQAIALAANGFEVTVIDKEPASTQLDEKFDGRVSAIAWKSYKFLQEIGVWKYVEDNAEAIEDIRVSEFGSGHFLHFDHREIGDESFGYIVENRHTRYALYKRAEELPSLKIIAPAEIVAVIDGAVTIKDLATDHIYDISCSLVIAADGKNSKTRELAGIKTTGRKYGQMGIVCTIEHEKPHMGLAHEYFLPTGPFAVLPMQNNRSSLVWTEQDKLAPLYMKMNETDFNAEIAKRVKHLGKTKALPRRWCYPLELLHADRYTSNNIILVGDAAHAIHPIAGQGVNLGFRDVITLTRMLTQCRKLGLTFKPAGYEKERRLDNYLMIEATDKINRLFSNNILPLKLARAAGLGLVNEVPVLRRLFMKYASGKI